MEGLRRQQKGGENLCIGDEKIRKLMVMGIMVMVMIRLVMIIVMMTVIKT